jgi:hypothetical protein
LVSAQKQDLSRPLAHRQQNKQKLDAQRHSREAILSRTLLFLSTARATKAPFQRQANRHVINASS